MSKLKVHIVSFDVPCPADYGGIIDVLGKIIALSESGIDIVLHCFQYGRKESEELKSYCNEIHYYERKSIFWSLFSIKPTIVSTRTSNELLNNLLKDNAPILFEGLHTCAYLAEKTIKSRMKLVRMHNVEHDYYSGLANSSESIWKKLYLRWEAYRLGRFESNLTQANKILAISNADKKYLEKYGETYYLPAFHLNKLNVEVENKNFALYHGNLQVEENEKAATFLTEVFENLPYKLKIAGRNPCSKLQKRIAQLSNVELIPNPSHVVLKKLILEARVNCLPTFQATGIKLKLIQSLIEGNDVIVNEKMIKGTALKPYCIQANSLQEWRSELHCIFKNEMVDSEILSRRKKVSLLFNNAHSAKQLGEWFAEVR